MAAFRGNRTYNYNYKSVQNHVFAHSTVSLSYTLTFIDVSATTHLHRTNFTAYTPSRMESVKGHPPLHTAEDA